MSNELPGDPADPQQAQNASTAISNLIVRLLSEYTGRGPRKARTYMSDDVISVVVRDTLTKGEQSLVREGHEDHVLATRELYQRTMRAAIVEGVEEITGRKVIAFLSANHLDPDLGVETMIMEPRQSDRGTETTADAG
ncbi:MAG: hypothetical protein JWM31_3526 [Solirubrobacterales bacterium]|nr:hypothetical protein [Solirubrobacterales bacterium]